MVVERLYEGATKVELPNGLRILIEEVPQSRSVSIGAWVQAGSRDDPEGAHGLAHFVEHLLFKGTTTRSALRVSQEIDAVGGFLDAATGKESTFYYADVPADGLSKAVDLLLDLVFCPLLAADKIELERNVVLEEIRGYDDDPEQTAFDHFIAGLWADNHPLSRPVLGSRASMEAVTRRDIVAFHERFYRPSNMVIAAAGAIDVEALIVDIERRLSGLAASPRSRPDRHPPVFLPARAHHVQPTGQTHVYLGLSGPLPSDPARYPLEVANAVLGDGTSSRLFSAIREDRGLAYAVQSSVSRFTDAGLWLAYAAVAPEAAGMVIDLLLAEFDRLRSETIPEEEISLAKSRLRGSFILGLESNAHRAMRLGMAAISDREILSPDRILSVLESVDGASVAAAVHRYDCPEAVNVATVGPQA